MIVSELIAALQKMPQDARVILTDQSVGTYDHEVRDVLYNGHNIKQVKDRHTVELDNWPASGFTSGQLGDID
jgi:hypothetical protein